MEQKLKDRLEELLKQRADFLELSKKELFAYDVVIGELQHLLLPDPTPEEPST